MRSVRISENFVPVSEFKAQAADWLRKLAETGAPVVVTQNGKPAGVLLSPQAFDERIVYRVSEQRLEVLTVFDAHRQDEAVAAVDHAPQVHVDRAPVSRR